MTCAVISTTIPIIHTHNSDLSVHVCVCGCAVWVDESLKPSCASSSYRLVWMGSGLKVFVLLLLDFDNFK